MGAAATSSRPRPGMLSRFQFVLPVGLFLTRKLFFLHLLTGVLWENESEGNRQATPGFCSWIGGHGAKWNPQKMRFRSGRRTRAVGSTQHAFIVSPSDGSRA